MLKITSRNEKLNRRMAQKENTRLFTKFSVVFSFILIKPKCLNSQTINHRNFWSKKTFRFSKRQFWYDNGTILLNWQSKLLFQSSFTKARTICFLTGRSRSVYRAFHLSRLKYVLTQRQVILLVYLKLVDKKSSLHF